MVIARISGNGMEHNRYCNAQKHSLKKRLNEYVSIAYFSNRKLLKWNNLFHVAFCVVKPVPVRLDLMERYFKLLLFFRLLACRFSKPEYKSRYF